MNAAMAPSAGLAPEMAGTLLISDCVTADVRGPRNERLDIVVRDGVISKIRPAGQIHERSVTQRVEASGATVVPGLINMHEHLGVIHPGTHEERELEGETSDDRLTRMTQNATRALGAGVTGMRLVGEHDGLDIFLRDRIEAGEVAGPRIWTAGQALDYPGGARGFVGAVECATPDAFRGAALEQIDRGADFLKVMMTGGITGDDPGVSGIGLDEFDAIRLVARQAGVPIAIHTAATPHAIMNTVVHDGLDSLEHCYLMDPALLQRCIDAGILLVLTPLVSRSPEYLEALGIDREIVVRITRAGETHWATVRNAVRGGARISLGTDIHSHHILGGAPAPVRELEIYEEAGAAPTMLLSIAAHNGAGWLGTGNWLGLVEEGYEADLLILGENPFSAGASAFRDIRSVISRGIPVSTVI